MNKLKKWRGLATRYDKTATVCLAALHTAGMIRWPHGDPEEAP
ncbi:hypothetical protein [Streptomyces platensis]